MFEAAMSQDQPICLTTEQQIKNMLNFENAGMLECRKLIVHLDNKEKKKTHHV